MSDNPPSKSEENFTSEKTEDIINEIKEVAEGLGDIVEQVEIKTSFGNEALAKETENLEKSKNVNETKVQSETVKESAVTDKPIEGNGDKTTSTGKPELAQTEAKPIETLVESNTQPAVKNEPPSTAKPETEASLKKDDEAIKTEDNINNSQKPMTEKTTKFSPFGFLKKKPNANQLDNENKKKMPKGLKIGLIVVGVLFLIIIVLIGITYLLVKPVITSGQKTMVLAQQTYQLLKEQDLVKAGPELTQTKASLLETQKAYQKLTFLRVLPIISTYQKDGEAGLNAAVAGVEAGELFIQAVMPYADVLGFTGEESTQSGTVEDRIVRIIKTLDKVSPQLDAIGQKLVIVDSNLQQINPQDYPEKIKNTEIRSKIIKAESLVFEAKKALTDAQPLVKVLPSILGYPDSKKYLVIFQNDGELRPTGGFMSAFAVLNLDKGRVNSEKSDDIYGLDGKFSKVLVPPEPIKNYLNEKKWYLRNMNWSPDFKASMDTFKENYDTLKDEYKVDGIIAIDTQVLERIVDVTGPLEVPEWGTFTTENDSRCNLSQIICEIEHIVDRPLATLVTNRKATILGPMMKALLDKSMGGGKQQLAKLIPLAFELMEQKHVLMYFNNETQQQAAESFNIAGRIMDYSGDYLHVNNANLGGAKSNFYVDESVNQEISVDGNGNVNKKVTLSYKHNESADNCNLEAGQLCLSGILRSYFRVYVPAGSVLNEDNSRGSMVKITNGEDLGKTYFEGFYELRPQSQVKIELEFTIPYKPANGEYDILIQKQPGVKTNQETININGKSETFDLTKDTEKKIKI